MIGMRIGLVLLALATSAGIAQSSVSNFLLEETTVHPGGGGQFEAAQKDYCAAVVRGGAPACLIFSTATFGESGLYFTLLPFTSFVHYDQGKYTEKGLTPEQAKALSARRTPPIATNRESAVALHRDLSVIAVNDAPLNYFTEYRVRPGCVPAFLEAIRRYLLPVARRSGVESFEVITTTVGESPDRVWVVTRLKKFADLDQPDAILSQMSSSQRHLFEVVTRSSVEQVQTFIMRYRSDLSIDPRRGSPPQNADWAR